MFLQVLFDGVGGKVMQMVCLFMFPPGVLSSLNISSAVASYDLVEALPNNDQHCKSIWNKC